MLSKKTRLVSLASAATLMVGIASCGGNQSSAPSGDAGGSSPAAGTAAGSNLSGQVQADGSSTVLPIMEAVAEEFQKANSGVQVTVGSSGTGGGFKKFCAGEIDISNASRPIKEEEIELCQKANIEYIEVPVAYDGLSVVANPQNNFAQCLKVDELKKMWEPAAQGKVSNWSQVRSGFPNQPLALYGPGTDSGTFDYFTDAVNGEEGASRGDYTASEDDNTLVQGVSQDQGGLGYFGYAYYEQNKDKIKLVEIDSGNGCVAPSPQTIADGTYAPLSRPLFIYVKKEAAARPEVKALVDFALAADNKELISEVGYVPLPDDTVALVKSRFEQGKVGSAFGGKEAVGVTIKELLEKEK
ncbi:PstS family phosphate ABC transporter substrate-binding protein [Microcoleus sp. FACHB-SPT15]|uniref:PstS family phosphate ABC transporter substrate-binding protein n=1 Tax=Microcoleus sp. FACHB-SPT15 TaxID=2692830 RepID=UPI00178134F8|nr:PstS family phosphate ABC transporter substrate-binding protein [Microcoleus sp. FACHB-SPT15]MBD1808630.1 PstS family phosphate ABC transporter substrate-binding protein [Microcoleus sp. FACHB-SPT15]